MTILSSTANVISDEDYLVFPSHPKFDYQPDGLIGFGDWVCSGIWVGTGEEKKEEFYQSPAASSSPQPQRTPTIDLSTTLTDMTNDAVPYLPRGDAWKIARSDDWVEPNGTRKGTWDSDATPFKRTLKALTQFLNSRQLVITKAHQVVLQKFRDLSGLTTDAYPVPHLPSGCGDMLGSDGQKKKVYEEQEDCAFLRDMEGCLRGIWKEMIESPGKGWTKVSVGEMFDIIRSFLLYLRHYKIFSPITESYLHRSLLDACDLSLVVQTKTDAIEAIYRATYERGDAWNNLGKSIWAPEVEAEEEERKGVDYSKIEVDEGLVDEMDQMIVKDVVDEGQEVEKEKEKQEENGPADGWDEVQISAVPAPYSGMAREDALAQLQNSISTEIEPQDYVVKHKITNGSFSIKDVVSASDADTKEAMASLSHLGKKALEKNPGGYRVIRLDIESDGEDKQDNPKAASILLDLVKQGTDYAKLQQGAQGLKIVGTLIGIGRGGSSEPEESLTWFLAKVKGVQSGI